MKPITDQQRAVYEAYKIRVIDNRNRLDIAKIAEAERMKEAKK